MLESVKNGRLNTLVYLISLSQLLQETVEEEKKKKRCINPQEKKRKGRANESRFFTKFSKVGDEGAKRKLPPEGPPAMKVSVKWIRPMEPL